MPRNAPPTAEQMRTPFRVAAGGAAVITAEPGNGDDGKPKLGTFEGVAYTGAVMQPGGWYGRIICDLAGIKFPADQNRPALRQHDHEQIVGHTTSIKVTAEGLKVGGVFSGQAEHVEKVATPARNGFKWQQSIGATPTRTEWLEEGRTATVNGREVTGPLTISRETELGEISFVPLGADGDTSATVAASRGFNMKHRSTFKAYKAAGSVAAAKYSDADIDAMTEDDAKAALRKCQADDDGEKPEKKEEKPAEAGALPAITAAAGQQTAPVTDVGKQFLAELQRELREGAAAEHRRHNEITARVQSYGVQSVTVDGRTVDLIPHAIANNWTADQAELYALRAARPGAGVGGGPLVYSTSSPELSEAVVECAVFQAASQSEFKLFDEGFYARTNDRQALPPHIARRVQAELNSRYPDKVQQAAHTTFRGRIGLHQLLATVARANGFRCETRLDDGNAADVLRAAAGNHTGPRGFHADGTSNYSLSNVLANVLGKMMLAGYLYVEQAWREFAGIRPVNDFKPTKSMNLFGDVEYKKVGSTGELANASLSDQAFANQADQYGRILTIDRKSIINDDLGALTTVPMLLGRGAGLLLNKLFWTVFLSPGNADDGNAFWNNSTGTHGTAPAGQQTAGANYQTGGGTALSSAALQSAVVLFNKQVDPLGYPLGVDAEILLYPPELDVPARELMNSQFLIYGGGTAAKQPNTNIWSGRFKPVMSRYLSNTAFTGNSATAHYLLAGPGLLPVIEVAFLNGVDVPQVQTAGIDYQFDRVGISVRGLFDAGVTMQNFRGGVKSAGA